MVMKVIKLKNPCEAPELVIDQEEYKKSIEVLATDGKKWQVVFMEMELNHDVDRKFVYKWLIAINEPLDYEFTNVIGWIPLPIIKE